MFDYSFGFGDCVFCAKLVLGGCDVRSMPADANSKSYLPRLTPSTPPPNRLPRGRIVDRSRVSVSRRMMPRNLPPNRCHVEDESGVESSNNLTDTLVKPFHLTQSFEVGLTSRKLHSAPQSDQ
jgi:hypothetical protein